MKKNILVMQSDFGLVDGAVSAMYGVAKQVDVDLNIEDLTHDITPFNIWEASYRLMQTVKFWPEGTVFVSVVDPGVGSERKSVVVKTKTGHYIVTPDNGTLTHIKKSIGILESREIDETINRLKGSEESHTFHGRDVYSYTGARLASGTIDFEGVGPLLKAEDTIELKTNTPEVKVGIVKGNIEILDVRFGSLWSNITHEMFKQSGIEFGDRVQVKISHKDRVLYNNQIKFGASFSEVNIGEALIYINSLLTVAVAINQGNFAKAYNIKTGLNWLIEFEKVN